MVARLAPRGGGKNLERAEESLLGNPRRPGFPGAAARAGQRVGCRRRQGDPESSRIAARLQPAT